jgi:hypothetical protein
MNSSTIELFYLKIGSTVVLDLLYFLVISPLGFFGFFLNLLSFIIISKIQIKKIQLKIYFQAYTIACSLTCLLPAFLFLTRSPRYVQTYKSYYIGIYRCKIMPFNLTTFFFINLLDCFILLERSSHFRTFLKKIAKINPHLVVFTFTCICISLDFPNYITNDQRFDYEFDEAFNNYSILIQFTYCKRNKNVLVTIFPIVSIIVKDILLLVFEISLAIYSIVLFKNYIKKMKLKNFTNKRISFKEPIEFEPKKLTSFDIISSRAIAKLKDYNLKLTKVTIFLSVCSISSHIGLLICYVIFFLNDNSILAHSSYMLCLLFLYLKCFSTFAVFYRFNQNFRCILKYYLTICKQIFSTILKN